MNDLRLILLGIGLSIIVLIYFWGTFKQKSEDRARTRKLTSFKRDHDNVMQVYDEADEVSEEVLAEMEAFLNNPEPIDLNTSDFPLPTNKAKLDEGDLKLSKAVAENPVELPIESPVEKPAEPADQKKQSQDVAEDEARQRNNEHQIITFLIKAAPGKTFFGANILAATDVVGMKFGDMNIFHHHGVDGMEFEESIFSLASMYEPGYFDLDKMVTYQTKGLTLFMQLPAPMDNIMAFDLLQETAMRLADLLQGEIWSAKHEPIDAKALQAMRDVVVKFS
jgi:cell division protein ZipA